MGSSSMQKQLPQEFQLTASTSSADSEATVRHQSEDVICCLLDLFFYLDTFFYSEDSPDRTLFSSGLSLLGTSPGCLKGASPVS